MRIYLFLILLVVLFPFASNASSTLIFSGDDYEIQVVVSDTAPEQILTVNFGSPAQKDLIAIIPGEFAKIRIDCEHQKLILVLKNPRDAKLPCSFKMRVRKDKAYILIGGKRIKLKSDWIR